MYELRYLAGTPVLLAVIDQTSVSIGVHKMDGSEILVAREKYATILREQTDTQLSDRFKNGIDGRFKLGNASCWVGKPWSSDGIIYDYRGEVNFDHGRRYL